MKLTAGKRIQQRKKRQEQHRCKARRFEQSHESRSSWWQKPPEQKDELRRCADQKTQAEEPSQQL
jgi:hypothetical protein